MKKEVGFTLIELIVVIVLLGVLAVTAAPKFLNLQADAYKANLQGVEAALKGSNSQLYAKALIGGIEKDNEGNNNVVNTDVYLKYGYLAVRNNNDAGRLANLLAALDVNATAENGTGDFWVDNDGNSVLRIAPSGYTADTGAAGNCFLEYTEAANATTPPTYTITDSGC